MTTPSIAPLRNVAALIALIDQVQNRAMSLPGMATFYGPSGWGKTTAVTVAANEYQAYCVQVKDCWTRSYLCQAILQQLGLKPQRSLPAMVDQIGAHLAATDRPLIIDDAQYLARQRMIELARDIYEASQAPVILVGEEQLPQSLTRWENIHNRMLAWEPAQPCGLDDAARLAPIYAAGIDVDEQLLAQIVEASGGSIRRVAVNLARARELALSQGATSVMLADWGDRAFETGQPPAARRPEDLRPDMSRQLRKGKAAMRRVK